VNEVAMRAGRDGYNYEPPGVLLSLADQISLWPGLRAWVAAVQRW